MSRRDLVLVAVCHLMFKGYDIGSCFRKILSRLLTAVEVVFSGMTGVTASNGDNKKAFFLLEKTPQLYPDFSFTLLSKHGRHRRFHQYPLSRIPGHRLNLHAMMFRMPSSESHAAIKLIWLITKYHRDG